MTALTKNADLVVSPALNDDIPEIHRLLGHYAKLGQLLPRTRDDIKTNLEHFRVIKRDDKVVACGSLEHFTAELAEIRSLMVDPSITGGGLGKTLVRELLNIAEDGATKRVMALTYVPEFFHKLGFKTVDRSIFPEKVWGICVNCYKFNNCDEIAVLLEL